MLESTTSHSTEIRMKKVLITLILITFAGMVSAQPFSSGHYSKTFQDPSRNNRNVTAEIYYPADAAGNNVPIAVNGGNFPVVVFGHGFVMTWEAYENIWEALNAAGYIAVFPTTESGFSPNHSEFGKDIAFLVTAIQSEGQLSSSILFGRVSGTSAVMGHSMGGGSSFLAIQHNPSITAIANLAAAETNPSAIGAASNITIPALVIAGANDCITPPGGNQLAMYNALSSTCKAYVSITGASHCQFANSNFNCNFGELTCSPAPTISRATQHGIVNQVLIPWLDYQLKSDCNQAAVFENLIANPSGFTAQKNCVLCPVSDEIPETALDGILIYPTITGQYFQITSPKAPVKNAVAQVFDARGKMMMTVDFSVDQNESFQIDASEWSPGIYFVRVESGSGFSTLKKVLRY